MEKHTVPRYLHSGSLSSPLNTYNNYTMPTIFFLYQHTLAALFYVHINIVDTKLPPHYIPDLFVFSFFLKFTFETGAFTLWMYKTGLKIVIIKFVHCATLLPFTIINLYLSKLCIASAIEDISNTRSW